MGCYQIISFVILAVLRRSLLRVRGSHLSVILPAGNTDSSKMLQRWQPVGSTVSDLTGPKFEQQILAPETDMLPLEQLPG